MFNKNWKKEILTIPNLLSLFRLLLIPVYVSVYFRARIPWQYYAAGGILALSCVTDFLDGFIARRFHMATTLGSVLDPLADKATQLTLTFCLCIRYPALQPVLILLVVKEGFQLTAGLHALRQGKILAGALPAGKLCTAVLFVSLIVLVLFPGITPAAVKTIALMDGLFLWLSFISYILVYWENHTGFREIK